MSEQRRLRIGVAGSGAGLVLLAVGILAAHFTGLPGTNAVGQEIYPHIPRCLGDACWILPTFGQLIALVGSQVLLAAIVYGWVLGRPLTWASATVAAMVFTVEMLIVFGVVPNQWLAIAQGDLEWTGQKIWFTVPKWLVLNNDVGISYGALKDVISGGYSALMLVVVVVGAYRIQEHTKRGETAPTPAPPVSAYGRTLVKGGR